MTAIADQCKVIRDWLNLGEEVYPDSVVTSWIRMAEESISTRLRVDHMIQIDVGTIVNQRYKVPVDWREMDFVRVVDGKPLRYTTRDDFYNPAEPFKSDRVNCYTMIGRYIIIGANTPEGAQIEISYYQDIPPLGDTPTWFITKLPTLATVSVLDVASMYAIEDERGPIWKKETDSQVDFLNAQHLAAKSSGSRLTQRHRRSFG